MDPDIVKLIESCRNCQPVTPHAGLTICPGDRVDYRGTPVWFLGQRRHMARIVDASGYVREVWPTLLTRVGA